MLNKSLQLIPYFLITVLFFEPVKACKLWSVCTKSTYSLSSLPFEEFCEIEDQLNTFFQQSEGFLDGWSLLAYGDADGDSLLPIHRSNIPATQDSVLYWSAVEKLLEDSTNRIGIGHLRIASSGANSIDNPHPWMFYDSGNSYSLVHNGTVNKNILYNLITNEQTDLSWIEANPPNTFGEGDWQNTGWENVVDSELILIFFMKNILSQSNILLGLQSGMEKLINAGVPPNQLNLIFSDGLTLYVFGGTSGLYFAESADFFSVMTTPGNNSSLTWTSVNSLELLTFSGSGSERYQNFISTISDEEIIISPQSFSMGNAYPNPFNGNTSFTVEGITFVPVEISIFSLSGRLIEQFNLPNLEDENRVVRWNPAGEVATGTYIVRAKANKIAHSKKISFIK